MEGFNSGTVERGPRALVSRVASALILLSLVATAAGAGSPNLIKLPFWTEGPVASGVAPSPEYESDPSRSTFTEKDLKQLGEMEPYLQAFAQWYEGGRRRTAEEYAEELGVTSNQQMPHFRSQRTASDLVIYALDSLDSAPRPDLTRIHDLQDALLGHSEDVGIAFGCHRSVILHMQHLVVERTVLGQLIRHLQKVPHQEAGYRKHLTNLARHAAAVPDLADSLEAERELMKETLGKVLSGEHKDPEGTELPLAARIFGGRTLSHYEAILDEVYGRYVEILDQPVHDALPEMKEYWKEEVRRYREPQSFPALIFSPARSAAIQLASLSIAAGDSLLLKDAETRSLRDGLTTVLGILLFRTRKDVLPARLSELREIGLTPQEDALSNSPFHYELTRDGFSLHGLGANGENDGGDKRRDVPVWPSR